MRPRSRTTCRIVLAICLAWAGWGTLAPAPTTSAASSATWHWQNPLPRGESVAGVACPGVTTCVAVERDGSVVTTVDGARHWTHHTSGTKADLYNLKCPDRTTCYALGSVPANGHTVFLASADGGKTWRQPSAHLPVSPGNFVTDLVCPSATTCLILNPAGSSSLSRTGDGGKTWHSVNVPGLTGAHVPGVQGVSLVACTTRAICYAIRFKRGSSPAMIRSVDGGKTWKVYGRIPRGGVITMACPGAATCLGTASNCGGECSEGDVFLTRDGTRTWREVAHNLIPEQLWNIACPNVTTCYGLGSHTVVRTTSGGKSWSIRHLPDPSTSSLDAELACPSPRTCYVAAGITVLKTGDGYDHIQRTLAHSALHDLSLTDISCPNTVSCYAVGSRNVCPRSGGCNNVAAPMVATTNGGKTWRATPKAPDLLERLSCPRPNVCFAIDASKQGPIAVDRSDDGAKTWHQIRWQQISSQIVANGQASDITCVGGTTCFLLATVPEKKQGISGPVLLVAVLVTHNSGRTWSVQTAIDAVARAGGTFTSTNVTPSFISCPSVTTCFVLAAVSTLPSPGHPKVQVVILSTTDGGRSWTRHRTVPGTVPDSRYPPLGQDLSCPTITTCYLLSFKQNPEAGNPNGVPGPVLVTHDAGATWQRHMVTRGEYLSAISCATAQSCRVASSTMFATNDGGGSWRRELTADGSPVPPMLSIACLAVNTCYAVGGLSILATHPPGALSTHG